MKKPLYKTKLIIWSEFDPTEMETEDLVKEAANGEAYCSCQSYTKVEKPEEDGDWDFTEFFGE
jgi:hypothetical protein